MKAGWPIAPAVLMASSAISSANFRAAFDVPVGPENPHGSPVVLLGLWSVFSLVSRDLFFSSDHLHPKAPVVTAICIGLPGNTSHPRPES